MKRVTVAVVGSLMLLLVSMSFAAAQDRTFSGEIMDSSCAKMDSHDAMMK